MANISNPQTAKTNAAISAKGGRGWSKKVESARIKERFLKALGDGYTVNDACRIAGWETLSGYKYARRTDEDFRFEADKILSRRGVKTERERAERAELTFPEFSERYLKQRLFNHQLQWYDLLEGKDPRNLHPSQRYDKGDRNAVIINTPPEHSKSPLALDTEVLTTFGWSTIGDLRVGDQVFGLDGKPTTVLAKSPVVTDKRMYRLTMNCGESFLATEDHRWTVQVSRYAEETLTTQELFERGGKFNLPRHEALVAPGCNLSLDPYLLGLWLGDGHTASGRFTTKDPEVVQAFADAGYEPKQYAEMSYDTHGFYRELAELGLIGHKDVPEGYMLASFEDRLALLQGLMDSDGTCGQRGQASFTSTKKNLAEGVLYLASSLGLRPTIKEGRATLNGKDCGPKWTVWFSPGTVPVFRLERKLKNQVWLNGPRDKRSNQSFRKIVSIEPVEAVPAQCIYVDNDSHLFLIGRSLVPTHNTTITMNYVTYRICMDPSVRILIVSKTQGMAKKFLNGIKARLTSRRYSDLIREFSPEGGFDGGNAVWRQDMIYVNQETSEDGVAEKDPTVEALGIGGQIYGARADLIIVDDGVTLDNVGQVEHQIDWVQQEVMTRLGAFGRMIVVGTRVAPIDLYVELANPKRYPTGQSPWTYLTQPAVLEMNDDPEKWVPLWPKSNMPMVGDASDPDADGLYDYWTGPRMLKVRNTKQPRTWAMVYMQQQVDEEAVFPATDVQGCVDGFRSPGRLHPDREGGPAIDKNQGEWYIIAGMDPATVQGFTAITVYGFNRRTQKRRVIEVVNARLTPDAMVNKMKDLTIRFDVDEWRVEKNAFQAFLTQTKEVVQFMASRGVLLREHTTGRNKHDSDFGVSAMAMLFRNWQDRNNMISLPAKSTEGVRALIEQLVTWAPDVPKTQKTDAVMSLWFAELRARELVGEVGTDEYMRDDGWLGANDREAQEVISIDQYRYAQQQERLVGF